MRKVLTPIVAISAVILLGIILVQRFSRDPEVSNPTDLRYDAQRTSRRTFSRPTLLSLARHPTEYKNR